MFKKLDEATTPAEMRAAIERHMHERWDGRGRIEMTSPIIRQCLHAARYHGLSAEDTYSMMAYHALRSLADMQNAHIDLLNTMPMPSFFLPADAEPPKT